MGISKAKTREFHRQQFRVEVAARLTGMDVGLRAARQLSLRSVQAGRAST